MVSTLYILDEKTICPIVKAYDKSCDKRFVKHTTIQHKDHRLSEQKVQQFREKTPDHRGPVQFQREETPPVTALVLVPVTSSDKQSPAQGSAQVKTSQLRAIEDQLNEAEGLARAIDLDVLETRPVPLDKIRPSTLFGKGKVEEIKALADQKDIELVIIDHPLSPGQQRNLERSWKRKVLDRTGLILEIFGRRAATKEGRLQVELAHLNYQKSRLVRSWTHLERQRGGAGFMGGPGETQLEADKRQLQGRILSLSKDLEKVRKTRELHRQKRRKVPFPVIALVGYTNAGKSTLFNRLTGAKVLAKDQLFATLDPTMRAIELPSGTKAILSDTVGFISNLPTQLIAAFRATLEEVLEADIILHVEDISNPNRKQHALDVLNILKELGVNQSDQRAKTPIITIWNKIDQLEHPLNMPVKQTSDDDGEGQEDQPPPTVPIPVSAITGQGMEELYEAIEKQLAEEEIFIDVELNPNQGRILSWLYENADVTRGQSNEQGNTKYRIKLPRHLRGQLAKQLREG